MILYLDTSSLVKLFVEESGSDEVGSLVNSAEAAGTSIIAYAECWAAFARKFREDSIPQREYKRLVFLFNKKWEDFFHIHTSSILIKLAGSLAEKHALRGFDAVHLASAIILQDESGLKPLFSCFDDKLQQASIKEDLAQS